MREKREKAIKFFQDMQECTYGNSEEVDMAIHALEQERNVIEELEKIKEEIEDIWIKSAKDLKTGEVIYENLCEHSEVLEILANHISELKGENK